MRIVVFGGSAFSLINFRGHLIEAMVKAGHEVIALAPEVDPEISARLNAMGATYHAVPLNRTGLGPISDLRSVWVLQRLFRELRPDLLLAYTIKPVIWGSMAARFAGVPSRFAMITGLGSGLQGKGIRGRALANLITGLYRFAMRGNKGVFFQNPDDRAFFESRGILQKGCEVLMTNGSGVDLDHFACTPLPSGPIRFLLVSRLLKDKGILDYVEAARLLKGKRPDVSFQLLGPLDSNPTSVTQGELDAWIEEGVVDYLGATRDVRPYLAASHVFVLPSYGEGTPRSVLEAMAMGRAVVTTLAPGCRETVLPGRSGFLVPVRNPAALAGAMTRFIEDPALAARMGAEGRTYVEAKYDVHTVNRDILQALDLARVSV